MIGAAAGRTFLSRTIGGIGLMGVLVVCARSGDGAQDGPRPGANVYPETSSAAEALLRNAALHLRDGQWDAAIELLTRAMESQGDVVTRSGEPGPVEAGFDAPLFVQLRAECQRQLGSMPPEALAAYQRRVEVEAGDRYRRAASERDAAGLRWIVEHRFCSSWGDDAAVLLGDLAFEDGRFGEAVEAYELVLPAKGRGSTLRYPDPSVDVGMVAAKQLVARVAAGDRVSEDELAGFLAEFGDRPGAIFGRDGLLGESLIEALREDGWLESASALKDESWPTFAGNVERSKALDLGIDVGSMLWSVPIDRPGDAAVNLNAGFDRQLGVAGAPGEPGGAPPLHPIIVGDEVLVSDGLRVLAYEVNRRFDEPSALVEPSWLGEDPRLTRLPLPPNSGRDQRLSLTVHRDQVYVRLGDFGESRERENGFLPRSILLAVDRSTEGKLLWQKGSDEITEMKPGGPRPLGAGFGGTPIADDDGVYVSLVKPGPQAMTWVAALDGRTGAVKWLRFVCGASSTAVLNAENMRRSALVFNPDHGHRLLSMHGTTIYYQTDLGALAAIDARSGSLRWLATYPRVVEAARGRREQRGLNPAIVADGLVIIAPSDATSIYAFDASTGRFVWRLEPPEPVDHLLGVEGGKLIATGDFVWTIDARTGVLTSQWPDQKTSERGYGRGLIAGGEVYWPTRDRIYPLSIATGRPAARPPIELREAFHKGGGNLVAADGYLIVAERDKLVVYCQNSRLIQKYRELIAARPEDATLRVRLARAAEATGDDAEALAALTEAARLGKRSELIDGRGLLDVASAQRYRLLMKLGKAAFNAGRWEEATTYLRDATACAPTPADRVRSVFPQAEASVSAGRSTEAVALVGGLLRSDATRDVVVEAEPNRRVRAELLVVERLGDLRTRLGAGAFADWDAEAASLLRRADEQQDPRLWAELPRSYPTSPVADDGLERLALWSEGQGDADAALAAYRRLDSVASDARAGAVAALGVARSLAALGRIAEARAAFETARDRFGLVRLEGGGGERNTTELAATGLAALDEAMRRSGRTDGGLPPWRLSMARVLGPNRRHLPVEGLMGRPDASLTFATEGTDVVALGLEGDTRWSHAMGEGVIWAGSVGGLLVVATTSLIAGLDLGTGTLAWDFATRGDARAIPDDPFRPEGPRVAPDESVSGGIGRALIIDERVFAFVGDRTLIAIDGGSGLLLWSHQASEGSMTPQLLSDGRRLLVQVREPNARLILDAETGEVRHRIEDALSSSAWTADPVSLGRGRAAMALDPRTVAALDLEAGTTLWEARDRSVLPRYDLPVLVGDGDVLLVATPGQISRHDPADGELRWTSSFGRTPFAGFEAHAILRGDRLYWLGTSNPERSLHAVDLRNGRLIWQRPIGDAIEWPDWGVRTVGDCLIAAPRGEAGESTGTGLSLPLLICRREDGRTVQRIRLPTSTPAEAIESSTGGLDVATTDSTFRLSPREPDTTAE